MEGPVNEVMQINEGWALGSDPLQWILLRRRKGPQSWYGVSFVSTTKEILARCMGEKGIPPDDAKRALDTLPDTFMGRSELVIGDKAPPLAPDYVPDDLIAPAKPQP
jgi:hypothetical protein